MLASEPSASNSLPDGAPARRPLPAVPAIPAFIEGLGVFVLGLLAFGWAIIPQDALITIDGYYHLAIARQMLAEGPFVDIRWLPLTILGDAGPDHHWLMHLLITPFALIEPRFMALKVACTVFAALVPLGLWAVARLLAIPWAPVFAGLGVTGALILPGRLSMLRAQNLAIIFIVLAIWALARRRHRMAALITLLFMWSYHGAVILGPLAIGWVAIMVVRERRFAWRGPAAIAMGGVFGLILSPWFPENVEYLLFHVLYKVGNDAALAVGREWQPVDIAHIVGESWPVLIVLFLALTAAGFALARSRSRANIPSADGTETRRPKVFGDDTLLALIASVGTFALYFSAWRFAEYFVPVAALTSGLLVRDALKYSTFKTQFTRFAIGYGVPLVIAGLIAFQGTAGLRLMVRASEFVPTKYAGLSSYLKEHARPGERVFNRKWEDFVFLMWHAPELRYITGLDPHYLAYSEGERFNEWGWIQGVSADTESDPAPLIRAHFDARWVVVDRSSGRGLAQRLTLSPMAHAVAESPWGWLFQIDDLPDPAAPNPEPGAP